jgi:hypothetical protein
MQELSKRPTLGIICMEGVSDKLFGRGDVERAQRELVDRAALRDVTQCQANRMSNVYLVIAISTNN